MKTVFKTVVESLTEKGEARNPLTPEDYRGITDGREAIFCGVCHEPKRVWREIDAIGFHGFTPVLCVCGKKRREARLAENTQETRRTLRNKAGDLSPECDFASSERNPDLDKCWRYAKRWDDMREKNIGLLFWGGNGSGKSHAAQCIANALLDRDPPVMVYVKTFSAILAGGYDKTEVLERVRQASLVVFDDLGAERGNDYALETIFAIVDARYQTKKPTIVTTNLSWEEIQNPKDGHGYPDMRRKRIYDRIEEMCVPIQFGSNSRRAVIRDDKTAYLAQALCL